MFIAGFQQPNYTRQPLWPPPLSAAPDAQGQSRRELMVAPSAGRSRAGCHLGWRISNSLCFVLSFSKSSAMNMKSDKKLSPFLKSSQQRECRARPAGMQSAVPRCSVTSRFLKTAPRAAVVPFLGVQLREIMQTREQGTKREDVHHSIIYFRKTESNLKCPPPKECLMTVEPYRDTHSKYSLKSFEQ